jgi:hypothetical protein
MLQCFLANSRDLDRISFWWYIAIPIAILLLKGMVSGTGDVPRRWNFVLFCKNAHHSRIWTIRVRSAQRGGAMFED